MSYPNKKSAFDILNEELNKKKAHQNNPITSQNLPTFTSMVQKFTPSAPDQPTFTQQYQFNPTAQHNIIFSQSNISKFGVTLNPIDDLKKQYDNGDISHLQYLNKIVDISIKQFPENIQNINYLTLLVDNTKEVTRLFNNR